MLKRILRFLYKLNIHNLLFLVLTYLIFKYWDGIIFIVNDIFEQTLKLELLFPEKIKSIIFNLKYAIILFYIYLFLWFLIEIYFLIKNKFIALFNYKDIQKDGDQPVENIFLDKLERKKTVEDVSKIIERNGESTFTLLIDGKWGEGKTSVINFVKDELLYRVYRDKLSKKEYQSKKKKIFGRNDYIFFDFNPWFFSCEKSIMEGFFEELSKINKLKSESKLLLEIISDQVKELYKIPLPFKKINLENAKKIFVSKLLLDNKKLIIFIDDIDRLSNKEKTLEVFKLVGEFQNLNNIIFVLSFDQIVMREVLKDEFKTDSEYLEKIINFTYKLYTDLDDINDYFAKSIKSIVDNKDFELLNKEVIDNTFFFLWRRNANWRFKTIRQVKIFLSSFKIAYRTLQDEVNVVDLFRLYVFKTFYPYVYSDIPLNYGVYVKGSFFSMRDRDQGEKDSIIKHINDLVENEKEDVQNYIKENIFKLFPEVAHYFDNHSVIHNYDDFENKQKICHPNLFDKYFLEDVPNKHIPDKKIFRILSNWNNLSKEKKKEIFSRDLIHPLKQSYIEKIHIHLDKMPESFLEIFIKDCYTTLLYEKNKFNQENNYVQCARLIFKAIDRLHNHKPDSRNPKQEIERKKITQSKLIFYKNLIKEHENIFFVYDLIEAYKKRKGWNQDEHEDFFREFDTILRQRIIYLLFSKRADIFNGQHPRVALIMLFKYLKSEEINNYIFDILSINKKVFPSILWLYMDNFASGNLGNFAKDFNAKKFYDFINSIDIESVYDTEECKRIKIFREAYLKNTKIVLYK
ncbi:hypothetical protein KAJ89_04355 [Candidatus Parcubacteria bacterium]|nr:hypothetical protein [Candidatus Parcubacteria bacterium]